MHTEHLQNVRPSWVAFGWFIAACVTGLAIVGLIALGILGDDQASAAANVWVALSFAVGFFAGGWFAGARTVEAPILHGIGIGLFSLVVWFLVNLFLGEPTGTTAWDVLSPAAVAGIILLQMAFAVLGAWAGRKVTHKL